MIELLAAAALAAPCQPPKGATVLARSAQVVVYRQRARAFACNGRRRMTVYAPGVGSGRLLTVRVAASRVAVAAGTREYVSVAAFDVARGRERGRVVIDGRLVRLALHRSGAVALSVAGGEGRGIHAFDSHGSYLLDRRVNAALRSLTIAKGRFRWRYRGQALSVPAGGGGRCPAAGPPHELIQSTVDHANLENSSVALSALRVPFVALQLSSAVHKSSAHSIRVFDLRDGRLLLEGCGRSYYSTGSPEPQTSLIRALLSASGRLACSLRTSFDGRLTDVEVVAHAPGGGDGSVLDAGTDIDPESLHVEGGTLVWTRGGARRTADFP